MRTVKVSKDCYIPEDNVLMITGYQTETIIRIVRDGKKENKVFDITYGKKIQSVVFLKSGFYVLCNTSAETLDQRIRKE